MTSQSQHPRVPQICHIGNFSFLAPRPPHPSGHTSPLIIILFTLSSLINLKKVDWPYRGNCYYFSRGPHPPWLAVQGEIIISRPHPLWSAVHFDFFPRPPAPLDWNIEEIISVFSRPPVPLDLRLLYKFLMWGFFFLYNVTWGGKKILQGQPDTHPPPASISTFCIPGQFKDSPGQLDRAWFDTIPAKVNVHVSRPGAL